MSPSTHLYSSSAEVPAKYYANSLKRKDSLTRELILSHAGYGKAQFVPEKTTVQTGEASELHTEGEAALCHGVGLWPRRLLHCSNGAGASHPGLPSRTACLQKDAAGPVSFLHSTDQPLGIKGQEKERKEAL